MIRISNLCLTPDESEDRLWEMAAKLLKVSKDQIRRLVVVKKSVDARKKDAVRLVYQADAEVSGDEKRFVQRAKSPQVQPAPKAEPVLVRKASAPFRPVVAGFGPAGLFAAYYLAKAGLCPIVLERGKTVAERAKDVGALMRAGVLHPESNILFGEGGAGTFSDGKLTTGIRHPFCRFVLETLHHFGAPDEILFLQRPHIGTDRLGRVVSAMREEILALGGTVLFETKLVQIETEDGRIRAVQAERQTADGLKKETIRTDALILATGHSARDTYEMLFESGVAMIRKPFSIGVRIEHPQTLIDKSQYGGYAGHPALPKAEYHLSAKASNGRGVYTFCMCPGGTVVPSASEAGRLCTNGMSAFSRDGRNANAALLTDVRPEDFGSGHPLAGIQFQRKYEALAYLAGGGGYRAPVQTVGNFLKGEKTTATGDVQPTYLPGVTPGDLRDCLPAFAVQSLKDGLAAFDRQLKGFALRDAVLTGVEMRSSSPVRMTRDQTMQASIRGLYPVGEGAGMAGGIMSSAVDGLKAADCLAASLLIEQEW